MLQIRQLRVRRTEWSIVLLITELWNDTAAAAVVSCDKRAAYVAIMHRTIHYLVSTSRTRYRLPAAARSSKTLDAWWLDDTRRFKNDPALIPSSLCRKSGCGSKRVKLTLERWRRVGPPLSPASPRGSPCHPLCCPRSRATSREAVSPERAKQKRYYYDVTLLDETRKPSFYY